ncbi:MAG: Hsp20/alpha crystallin family protein [Oxalobacter sp.]|nr:MAG: Hsp20/alpha crystallin family protein [Oxalobacter sp.]
MTKPTQTDKVSTAANETATMLPPVNVVEDSEGITLTADMPGVPKEKLSLQVESDALIIEGEVSLAMPTGMEATHVEFSLPRYRRVFTLSKELDSEKVSAEFNQGVLKLRIPKAVHAQARKVEIKVA